MWGLLIVGRAIADLPVSCARADVAGSWVFHLSAPGPARSSCGHARPDRPGAEPRAEAVHAAEAWTVHLGAETAESEGAVGDWTMAADAGFTVRLRGLRFVALSDFAPGPGTKKARSRCNRTLAGWYRDEARRSFGCFVGERTRAVSLLARRLSNSQPPDPRGLRRSPPTVTVDWTPSVPLPSTQGVCGDCYAIAVADMLTARHRIAQENTSLPRFAARFLTACGDYTQGCEGGFPYLAATWSQDVGLVVETSPAHESLALLFGQPDVCAAPPAGAATFRADDVRYVPSQDLARELAEEGPVVVSFHAPESLRRYTGGLYAPAPSDLTGPVTHSALLIGSGVDAGVPYWVVQNSWGEEWGERGRFRVPVAIARELQLESLAVAADVVDDDGGVVAMVARAA